MDILEEAWSAFKRNENEKCLSLSVVDVSSLSTSVQKIYLGDDEYSPGGMNTPHSSSCGVFTDDEKWLLDWEKVSPGRILDESEETATHMLLEVCPRLHRPLLQKNRTGGSARPIITFYISFPLVWL